MICSFVLKNVYLCIGTLKTDINSQTMAGIRHRGNVVNVSLSVIIFKEDNVFIAYCPAVNVYGYGMDEDEAKKSFEVSVSEFFRYTLHKDTLCAELEALGWNVKSNSKFTPPEFSSLLSENSDLRAIFNTHPFHKIDTGVSIPLPA